MIVTGASVESFGEISKDTCPRSGLSTEVRTLLADPGSDLSWESFGDTGLEPLTGHV